MISRSKFFFIVNFSIWPETGVLIGPNIFMASVKGSEKWINLCPVMNTLVFYLEMSQWKSILNLAHYKLSGFKWPKRFCKLKREREHRGEGQEEKARISSRICAWNGARHRTLSHDSEVTTWAKIMCHTLKQLSHLVTPGDYFLSRLTHKHNYCWKVHLWTFIILLFNFLVLNF